MKTLKRNDILQFSNHEFSIAQISLKSLNLTFANHQFITHSIRSTLNLLNIRISFRIGENKCEFTVGRVVFVSVNAMIYFRMHLHSEMKSIARLEGAF